MLKEENEKPKGIKCTVKVGTHTHAGKKCEVGDIIYLGNQKKIDRLRTKGIIA